MGGWGWVLWIGLGSVVSLIGVALWHLVCHLMRGALRDVSIAKAGVFAAGAFATGIAAAVGAIDRGYIPYKNDAINEVERKLEAANTESKRLSAQIDELSEGNKTYIDQIKGLNLALRDSASMCSGYIEEHKNQRVIIQDWAAQYESLARQTKSLEAAASMCAAMEVRDRSPRRVDCGTWKYSDYDIKETHFFEDYTMVDKNFDLRIGAIANGKRVKILIREQTKSYEADGALNSFACYVTPRYNIQVEPLQVTSSGTYMRVWYKGIY